MKTHTRFRLITAAKVRAFGIPRSVLYGGVNNGVAWIDHRRLRRHARKARIIRRANSRELAQAQPLAAPAKPSFLKAFADDYMRAVFGPAGEPSWDDIRRGAAAMLNGPKLYSR